MNPLTTAQTKSLLQNINDFSVQVFHHFPDIILVGNKGIDKEEFNALLAEKYIREIKVDSFGKFFNLTKKAELFLAEGILPIIEESTAANYAVLG